MILLALPATASAQTLAFPGAEGAGRHSTGGRGGQVLIVTTLADSGPGSLRAAIDAEGPRMVVFEVAGTIRLSKPLEIRQGHVTIAGESAPGGGITLRDQPLLVAADHVIIRYLRSRLGSDSGIEGDAIWIGRGEHIILDHVSASWSTDEALSISPLDKDAPRYIDRVTVQWSFITESLNRSLHLKGAHGYGSLVRGSHGARYSLHHNLWAHHSARMPRPGNYQGPTKDPTGPLFDFRNNLFYDWGGAATQGAAGYNVDEGALARYNFISNDYRRGPDSTGALAFAESNPAARSWFERNRMEGSVPTDPWSLTLGIAPAQRLDAALDVAPVDTDDAATAACRVLAHAGSSRSRDAVDLRIVRQVESRTGRLIDSVASVGGWPPLEAGIAPRDTDRDGLPDDWERRHGLDPRDARDGAKLRPDGYTALEHYLHSLVPPESPHCGAGQRASQPPSTGSTMPST